MSTSRNGLDPFEQKLKDNLEGFEVPYNSADWADMERTLAGGRAGWWMSGVGLSVLLAGSLAVGGGIWYSTARSSGNVLQYSARVEAAVTPATQVSANSINGTRPDGALDQVAESSTAISLKTEAPTIADNIHPEDATKGTTTAKHRVIAPGSDPKKTDNTPTPEVPVELKKATNTNRDNTFSASVSTGCPGTSVDFKVEHMPEDGIYLWNFGDGSFSNKPNPEHTFTIPGKYQVMLSMSAQGVGTIHNKPSSDVIQIHEAPKAAFNVLKQEYDGHLPSVHFENRSMAGQSYHWSFGDGETSEIPHPDHIYKKKGVYQVELLTTNDVGCVDQTMKEVRIDKDYNLDAPASFTPNGDGREDFFIPEALRTLGVKFHLAIYDTNGAVMYETNDATQPWLGKVNNRSEACPTGEYVWVVDVRESLHLAETYTGKVKLVR